MPTRGATTLRCFESIRPVKKTTTNAAARPTPTTLKTCFMTRASRDEGDCQAMAGPARRSIAIEQDRRRGQILYILTVCRAPPKGQRTISRDEAPRPEEATRTPTKGRGTVWAIEHRYSRQAGESYDDGWGTLDQASERGAPRARDDDHRGARQVDPVEERLARPQLRSARSIPTAAASTAASTASRGRRTATSACRRGSTSRPGSSPR